MVRVSFFQSVRFSSVHEFIYFQLTRELWYTTRRHLRSITHTLISTNCTGIRRGPTGDRKELWVTGKVTEILYIDGELNILNGTPAESRVWLSNPWSFLRISLVVYPLSLVYGPLLGADAWSFPEDRVPQPGLKLEVPQDKTGVPPPQQDRGPPDWAGVPPSNPRRQATLPAIRLLRSHRTFLLYVVLVCKENIESTNLDFYLRNNLRNNLDCYLGHAVLDRYPDCIRCGSADTFRRLSRKWMMRVQCWKAFLLKT